MNLRADHVSGIAFVGFGAAIILLSGDLPTGQLSMPGSGFLPKIVAWLLILCGIALVVRGKESPAFAELGWTDLPHAAQVVAIAAVGIALYTVLGFLITLILMVSAILIVIERRNPLRAGIYAFAIVTITYLGFEYVLKTPLPNGPWGF
jgi:hypothetical protein